MKKLLRGTDKILMALAFMGDLYLEGFVRSHGFGRKRSLFEALAIKNSTFRVEVARFLKTGEIEKVIDKKGRPCFRLCSPGYERLERTYPLFKLYRKVWDKKWRIVIFDIPEKERVTRDSLRFKIISLGFGKLQESVYISPLNVLGDLKEFLKLKKIYGKVVVFEAVEVFEQNSKVVANQVWKLDELSKEYRKIIDEAEWLEGNNGTNNEKEKIRNDYFQILLKDPLLPKELLPEDWLGDEARNKILSL